MWLEPRLADLPAKNRQLVTEHQNLQVLRPLRTAKKKDKLEHAADDEVDGRRKQRRPPRDGIADASGASAGRVSHPIEYLHPTGVSRRADGVLAGGTSRLAESLVRLGTLGLDAVEAVAAVTERPGRLLGVGQGRLEQGGLADVLVVDDGLAIREVLSAGRRLEGVGR